MPLCRQRSAALPVKVLVFLCEFEDRSVDTRGQLGAIETDAAGGERFAQTDTKRPIEHGWELQACATPVGLLAMQPNYLFHFAKT
jgi:hypothetical protein